LLSFAQIATALRSQKRGITTGRPAVPERLRIGTYSHENFVVIWGQIDRGDDAVFKLSWPMILKLLPFLPVPTKMVKHREQGGGVNIPVLLGDLLLFFCLAAWVTGIVIAIASLLS
jgi:hypothetical protein